MEDFCIRLLEFVHDLFRSAVKLVFGADTAAAFHDSSLNVVGQGRKKYFRGFAAAQQTVKVFIFSHLVYFLSREYFLRFFAEYTQVFLTAVHSI